MNHSKFNTKLTVIESTSCMSGRRIFVSKASISFVVSRLISIAFYVPGPLIFVATFLLDPSNLQKRVVASIQTTQSSKANDHQKRKKLVHNLNTNIGAILHLHPDSWEILFNYENPVIC